MADNRQTTIKRGDLKPDLIYTAYDGDHLTDLTDVVSWRLIAVSETASIFDDVAPIVTVPDVTQPWLVTLTHLWQVGETAAVRKVKVEAEAMWPGGKPQTFPPIIVTIRADLG